MSKLNRKRPRDDLPTIVSDELPVLEKCYMVERHADGKKEKILATIKDVKEQEDELMEGEVKTEDGSQSPTDTTDKKWLYYVHYDMLDRRNDEWVTRDRIFQQVESHGKSVILPEIAVGDRDAAFRRTTLTRSARRMYAESNHVKDFDNMDATTARLEKEHEERTKVKNIPNITIGKHSIAAWYYSPFPSHCNNHELYMCEYCLLYSTSKERLREHFVGCKIREPPGNEIYRKDELSIYEIDGGQEKLYCQCLCLLSKLFMDHKTLYFDVDDFMFYVLCEVDKEGAHIVGYFSREVESTNNLACIMVFPPYQDKGYGKLLIQLSYEISSREGYIGTPEKPLSDLGKVSYRSYWWWIILKVLNSESGHIEMDGEELAATSGIAIDDIFTTINTAKLDRAFKDYGDRHGQTYNPDNPFYLHAHRQTIDYMIANDFGRQPRILLDKNALRWEPLKTRDVFQVNQNQERRPSLCTPCHQFLDVKEEETPYSPDLSEDFIPEEHQF